MNKIQNTSERFYPVDPVHPVKKLFLVVGCPASYSSANHSLALSIVVFGCISPRWAFRDSSRLLVQAFRGLDFSAASASLREIPPSISSGALGISANP
jgi:hypothetical protein